MREAIGGSYVFQIVVVFILLFTGFMSLSINYSRAFAVSSEVANIIERNNGLSETAREEIIQYMIDVGYRTKGTCNEEEGENYEAIDTTGKPGGFMNKKNNLCVQEVPIVVDIVPGSNEFPATAYYKIKVFFKLDIPVMSMLFEFDIKSATKKVYYPA